MFGKISCWFFLTNNNETTKLYNICFSFIAHRIHKYNMYCRIEETSQSSRISIKKNTLSYYSVLSLLHQMKETDLFQNFALMLYVCIYTSNYYCVIYMPTRRGRQSLCCILRVSNMDTDFDRWKWNTLIFVDQIKKTVVRNNSLCIYGYVKQVE